MAKLDEDPSPEEVLGLSDDSDSFVVVNTGTDVLPGGWSAAMVPVLVDWGGSVVENDDDGYYLLRNVNVGGNPVAGITVLASIRVPCTAVREVEYVLVPVKFLGKDTPGVHAQLRLILDAERPAAVVDRQGNPVGRRAHVEDLVISWEAWRGPNASFHPIHGLKPNTYGLTARCFQGAQRFLEDGLRQRPWVCYPLQLPDTEVTAYEVLYTVLAFADGVGRHSTRWALRKRYVGNEAPRDYPQLDRAEWLRVQEKLDADQGSSDPVEEFLDGRIDYDPLRRSCITVPLQAIDVTLDRIHRRAGLAGRTSLKVGPSEVPSWIRDFAQTDLTGIFVRLPAMIGWLHRNQNVISAKSYEILEQADVLRRSDGTPECHRYDLAQGTTPYGPLQDHLIE